MSGKRGGGVLCGGGGTECRRSKREKSVIAWERGTPRERQGGKAARVPRRHVEAPWKSVRARVRR